MSDFIYPLSRLRQNEAGIVVSLHSSGTLRRRFQDIGIIEGTKISCIGKSPFGDPKAYIIKGAVIALRNTDAVKIMIKSAE
ncbi:MAG: ferrous iron transport protein A [Oscillospiraceae bacterium]|nr:ferrous iron transport protein A [Oscillospiraceae bacterium]